VGGKPFFTDAQGIGLTPPIAWTAPRTGQPTIYGLTIFRLSLNAANQLFQTQIATIVTPASSLTLPAGILAPGGAYVFSLTAFAATAPGATALLKGAPFRAGPDSAAASTVSGTFTP
jgi:hypothetical protein